MGKETTGLLGALHQKTRNAIDDINGTDSNTSKTPTDEPAINCSISLKETFGESSCTTIKDLTAEYVKQYKESIVLNERGFPDDHDNIVVKAGAQIDPKLASEMSFIIKHTDYSDIDSSAYLANIDIGKRPNAFGLEKYEGSFFGSAFGGNAGPEITIEGTTVDNDANAFKAPDGP